MKSCRPITVCLTTISSRIQSLSLVLQSILDQDYPDFSVRLYISTEPFLLDAGIQEIPHELRQILSANAERLSIHLCPNMGSYRKLLPLLSQEYRRDRLVITADDDTIYPSNWISRLYAAYSVYGCVICYRGHYMASENGKFLPYRAWMNSKPKENPSIFYLPTGKDGILYNTNFFDVNVLDYEAARAHAQTADDLWFKLHTALTGTKVYCIDSDYKTSTLETINHSESLYSAFNKKGGNDRIFSSLLAYAKKKFTYDFFDAEYASI